jgi:hypothetical protein
MVDGEETAPQQLLAGVPQGSPLSPILFLFYNAPLLEAVSLPELRLLWWGSWSPTWYGLQLFHSGVLVYSVSFAVS